MDRARLLNIAGLILNVAGICLLYWSAVHGRPMISSPDLSVCDMIQMTLNHDTASRWGFLSVIAGTLAQIAAAFMRR